MSTPLLTWRLRPWFTALALLVALLLAGRPGFAQVDTYTFAPSAGTYAPLVGGTNVSAIQGDDALSGTIPLGFSFIFDGSTFTSCKVSSNGWLTFNTAATGNSLTNALATGTAAERPRVAPFWDDLNGTNGSASYLTTGTAPNRVFTFEWLNWYRFGNTTGPSFSMQVQLVEGSNIVRFVYRRETGAISNASVSIGLSGVGTGAGTFLSLSDATATPTASSTVETTTIASVPPTGQVYTFTPPVPALCPTARNLTSVSTTTTSAVVSYSVTNTAPGPFTILYGAPGFNPTLPPSASNVYATTTSTAVTATITGLAPGTTYQFYVVQNCGGTNGNSNISNAGTFTTQIINDDPCGATLLTINNTCTPLATTTFGASTTASTFYGAGGGGTTCSTNTTPRDVWFRFTTAATGPTSTAVRVSVTGNPASVVSLYSGTACTGPLTFRQCSGISANTAAPNLDVSSLTANTTYYVRVSEFTSGNTLGNFTICLTPIPNCSSPGGLTAGSITSSSATLTWLAGAAGSTYNVYYGRTGFVPPAGTALMGLTTTSVPLSGLLPNTEYQFYVQQVCGGFNGTSVFSAPFTFTTALTPPANDEPCGAVVLTTGTPLSSTNVGATTTVQNSIFLPACSPSGVPSDVWFTYTPTSPAVTFAFTGSAAGMVRGYTSPSCSAGPFTSVFCRSSGANSTSVGNITVTGLTAGTLYYIAVSGYGSADASGPFTIGATVASAARAQADTNALLVYPNPSNTGQLTLQLNGLTGAGQATLLNALGQTVLTQELASALTEQTLTTSALATGIYTLRVTMAGQTYTRKVVLE